MVSSNDSSRPEKAAIAIIRRNATFLTIKRSQSVRAPGKICFPGGGIEMGETVEQALIREMDEELHAKVRPLCIVWTSTTAWGVDVSWVMAELLSDTLHANPDEVEWYRWMTLDELVGESELLESNARFLQAVESGAVVLDGNMGSP